VDFLSKYFFKALSSLVLMQMRSSMTTHQGPKDKICKCGASVWSWEAAEHYGTLYTHRIFLAFQLIILIDELGQGFKRSSSCVIKCYTMHKLHNILADLVPVYCYYDFRICHALKSPQKPGKKYRYLGVV